jgi:hypothetical protein
MLYPTAHTDYPSTTRGTSVGPPVAVNIDFLDISDFWALVLSEVYWYSTPLTTYEVQNFCSFHRLVLIFQLTVNCRASDKQRQDMSRTALLTELRSCYVSAYKSGFLMGFSMWRGSILVTQRNHDLHLSCSLPKHCGNLGRSEQNFSKLGHTVCELFIRRLAT